MDERDRLLEQYEDAWFALLMDGAAKAQGEELLRLNEQLKNDPAAEVPEEVRARCEKTIRDAFARKKLRRRGRSALRVLQRAAVAAVLGILMFSVAYAASEDVRVATLNALIDVSEIRTQFTFSASQADRAKENVTVDPESGLEYHYNIALEWNLDGYELSSGNSDRFNDRVTYIGAVEDMIEVSYTHYDEHMVYQLDTEDTTQREVTVQGHDATLYVVNDSMLKRRYADYGNLEIWSDMTVFWMDEENQVLVRITANNLTEDEMLQLAEGVHWKKAAAAEQAAKAEEYHIQLDWLPEGYEFSYGNSDGLADTVRYEKSGNGIINIDFTRYSDGLTYHLNTEDTTQQEVTVQGHDATLYVVDDSMLKRRYADNGQPEIWSDMTVFWMDEENQVFARVIANNMTEAEILRLAQGVQWTP